MKRAKPELVSPAGSPDKLRTAFRFGADAVYFGLPGLSLRSRAENFSPEALSCMGESVPNGRKAYCALNIVFRRGDLALLERSLESLEARPPDAFIISDPGVIGILGRRFPGIPLHLSTQASCSNAEAARFWLDLGIRRIIPARELALDEIADMASRLPELEIEVFAHGAQCMAYSGRCLMSACLSGRSGNSGECAHSCRWAYRALEEEKRRGQEIGIAGGEGFSLVFAPDDLCMIDHLRELREAGVAALKIEGRMKSELYVASVTKAYRLGLDALDEVAASDTPGQDADADAVPSTSRIARAAREGLSFVRHRPYTTGFFFGRGRAGSAEDSEAYEGEALFIARIGKRVAPGRYGLALFNPVSTGDELEIVMPDAENRILSGFSLHDPDGFPVDTLVPQKGGSMSFPERLFPNDDPGQHDASMFAAIPALAGNRSLDPSPEGLLLARRQKPKTALS